jgi:hypothetical protein
VRGRQRDHHPGPDRHRPAPIPASGSDAGDLLEAGCNFSFTASTRVLLANGTAVPIASLKPGDKVLATNTKTGKTSAETVTAVLLEHDNDLYNLTIDTAHGRTAVIHTTARHLFWNLICTTGSLRTNYRKASTSRPLMG